MEHAVGVGAFDDDLFGGDIDFVGIIMVETLWIEFQHNAIGLVDIGCCYKYVTRDIGNILTKELCFTLETVLIINLSGRLENEGLPFIEFHLFRQRDDIVVGFRELLITSG